MITKIEIDGIPPFKTKTTLETDQKVNLIYGLNGTGKSTLSNILYDYSPTDYSHKVTLDFSTGNADSYEFIVYNQEFVRNNFYESSVIEGIFSLSKDNAAAQAAIDNANSEKTELENQRNQKETEKAEIEEELKKAKNDITEKVWEIKTDYSGVGRNLDYCLIGLKSDKLKLFSYIDSVQKSADPPKRTIEDIQNDVSTLQGENAAEMSGIPALTYDKTMSEIEGSNLFSKVIVGNENSTIADFINKLNNSDWVNQGQRFLPDILGDEKVRCPFCQQETINKDFISELKSFFGGLYEKDLATLEDFLKRYEAAKNTILKYNEFYTIPILQSKKAEYESAYSKMMTLIDENIQTIKNKIEKPSVKVEVTNTSESLAIINAIVDEANEIINSYNEKIKQKEATLNSLKDEFWNIMRWKYDADLLAYKSAEQSVLQRKKHVLDDISKIETKIQEKDAIIRENQLKTVNIDDAVNNINNALLDMGIADFKIVRHSSENNLYRLSREGQNDDVFKSLSEGERMIISLLYFIELCKGKKTKENSDKKKIIVVDDPISSLSHIHVYNVGRLLIQEFTDANPNNNRPQKYEQVFLLTHSLYFFYEMAIIRRRDREDGYNQKLFRIQKDQNGSHIVEMEYSEIQNDYQAYWMIIKDNTNHPALIANCMRNIIEYFFAFVEKKELNNVFDKKELQEPKFRAFNRYINRESHSFGQNIFDIKEFDYNVFKDAFKFVFKLTGYEDHYNRMMK